MTDVRIAVVSMSARSPHGHDAQYLEWHTLDHLPEQYRIEGMRSGTRWVSTQACRAARAASTEPYDGVDHVVCYLFADPVDSGLDTFFELGGDLRGAGRMPVRLPAVELGGYWLAGKAASRDALIGADVLPWRPSRGVYLLLERGPRTPATALLDVAGIAGLWTYDGSSSIHPRLAPTHARRLTVAFLDDDPAEVAGRLAEVVQARWSSGEVTPLLAAPFVTVVPWQWDAALPE